MPSDAYLESLCGQLDAIPMDIASQVASHIFESAVKRTVQDSGQAAYHWQFIPYEGSPSLGQQEIVWGYGDVEPKSPVGYKWSFGVNSAEVLQYQFEAHVNALSIIKPTMDGIVVYNPIDSGFPDFHPNTDDYYPDNAFRKIDEGELVSSAFNQVYSTYGK